MPIRVSERTEKLKNKLFWLRFALCMILITPIFYFFVSALAQGGVESWKKVTLVSSAMFSLILIGVNFIFKFHLRSPLWFMLIGIHVVLNNVIVLLILLAVSSVLDEFILTPWIKHTKVQLVTNKEIDLRG